MSFFSQANKLDEKWKKFRFADDSRYQIVTQIGSHKLLFYPAKTTTEAAKNNHSPLFIIPSLISRPYVLDLLPGFSFIEFFQKQGFAVFLIDWGAPEDFEEHIDIKSLTQLRIPYFIQIAEDYINKKNKLNPCNLNIIGHCLGGSLAYLSALHLQKKFNSLILLTSPVDFSHLGLFSFWNKNSQIDKNMLRESFGNIPWPILHLSFLSMKPMGQYHRLKRFFLNKKNWTDEQINHYLALELWSHDSIALRGDLYLDLMNLLEHEVMLSSESTQNKNFLQNTPVLSVSSPDDHIVPHKSVMSQFTALQNIKIISFKGGHVGWLVNKKNQTTLWPEISQWIQTNNERLAYET